MAKIVELFGIARGEFFHFVFVPKSLVYVLLGVVFMSCSHSVLECVEFAEGEVSCVPQMRIIISRVSTS